MGVHLGSGSVWGKLKSTHGNYNWTTKLEASNERYDFGDGTTQGVYGTVQGTNEQKDTFVWASGALSTTGTRAGTISPLKVGAKKLWPSPPTWVITMGRCCFRRVTILKMT